jgi:hypothetical protein
MALTRDQIKAKRGVRQRVAVEVAELGTVYVAKFSAKDRDRFEQIVTGGKVGGNVNLENVRARFVTLVCVNEDGTKMFEDADSEWIGELDTDIVQAIVDAGFKLNGIGVNAVEEAAGK